MSLTYTAVKNPRYSSADKSIIDVMVTFDGLGEIPFTCHADDREEHAVDIYTRLMAGDFGDIAEFALPEPTAQDGREWRDGVLKDTQWLVDRHRDEVASKTSTTLSTADFKALQAYRQALRDWPQAEGFPAESSKPTAPDFLATA